MQYVIKRSWVLLLLACLSVPLFFLNIHDGHSPGGDDYAQYIKEAQNIASGRPYYESNYVFNRYNITYSPPQYPPGFPLLLAPVVSVWGTDIRAMCYFNSLVAMCLLFSFFFYFRRYASELASVCLAVVISYSGYMLGIKQAVLADASGLLFTMLYLVTRRYGENSLSRSLLLVIFVSMAVLIRTQSVLLLVAEFFYLLGIIFRSIYRSVQINWSQVKMSVIIISGSVFLLLFLNKVIFYAPSTASGFYVEFLKITLQKGIPAIIRDNSSFLLDSVRSFFHYDTNFGFRTAMVSVIEYAGVTFTLLGFVISVSRRLAFDDVFFLLLCGMMLYYPIHDERYFIPAIAITFYYCYHFLSLILPLVTTVEPKKIAVLVTVVFLFTGLRYFRESTKQPYGYVPAAADLSAFTYIREHVSDTDIILCARPRMLTLYTGKKCMIHAWLQPMELNHRVFDSMKVRYLLQVNGFVNDYYDTYMRTYDHPIDSIHIAPGYILYTLR